MTVIDESLTAKGFTPARHCQLVFGRPRTIEAITIHWWGVFGQTHTGVNNFFVYGVGETSAHFVASGVPTPRINCLVSPVDVAWHAGNAVGNATTIGIECRPEATDADYAVVAELVRFLRDTYGANLPLIPHRYWQATQCPGHYDLARIHRMAEALKVTAPKPIEPKPPVGEIVDISYDRDLTKPATPVRLAPGVAWTLKESDMSSNWNLAKQGLGYYDCDIFVQGHGLPEGGTVTVQVYIVTGEERNRAGYFTQDIEGSFGEDNKWRGNVRFKTPLLSTARVEVDVINEVGSAVYVDVWGSDTYAFKK